jgi:hypothetical protein
LRPGPEPLPLPMRLLHDICMISVLAVVFIPAYLLLNQYWKRLFLLLALYGLLALLFIRLGWYMRRVMRRYPADIPPWQPRLFAMSAPAGTYTLCNHSEVLDNVRKEPHYLQEVVKPRLRQLLAYRISGAPDVAFEELNDTQLARVDPALLDFLSSPEPTGPWAVYRYRTQRLYNLLTALEHVEAV